MFDANTLDGLENEEDVDEIDKIRRKKLLWILTFSVVVVAVLYAVWVYLFSRIVETDNAYVGTETAEITSMVSGQVAQVLVNDTQQVKEGQVLAIIDNRDAKIAIAQAEAELAKAKRQYSHNVANSDSLSSQVSMSFVDIDGARAQVEQARFRYRQTEQEYERRQKLSVSGAISKEEYTRAQNAINEAKSSLDIAVATLAQTEAKHKAAMSTLVASQALIKGASENSTPDVLVAKARLEQAILDSQRTEIKAPLDGVVARRNIQIGQRVAPGSSLMKIVPIAKLHVDANFKESQLKNVKIGQRAVLTSDLYGKKVKYHGTVVGFSGGTGSAFALIPTQNATGNWIKVVQRLPVRIQLDQQELAANPLRVGLSMNVEVDTSTVQ